MRTVHFHWNGFSMKKMIKIQMNLLANIFFILRNLSKWGKDLFILPTFRKKIGNFSIFFLSNLVWYFYLLNFFLKFRQFKIFDVSSCIDGMFDLSGNELYNQLHLCDHVMMNSAGIGFMIFLDRNRDVPPICMLNFLLTPQPL